MVDRRKIEEFVSQVAEPIAGMLGLSLVDVAHRRRGGAWVLEVTLDKGGRLSLSDCEEFSKLLSARLDIEEGDMLPGPYHLEVSSPGLTRTLKKDREFEIFAGREIQVTTYTSVEGKKRFIGRLEGLKEGRVMVADREMGGVVAIPRDQVAKAKLLFEG